MSSPVHSRLSPIKRLMRSQLSPHDFTRTFSKSTDLRSPSPIISKFDHRLEPRFNLHSNRSLFPPLFNPHEHHRRFGGKTQKSLFDNYPINGGYGASEIFARAFGTAAALSPFALLDSPKKRMKERLEKYGFIEKEMKGDGNCMFRSIADQVYGDESQHIRVRKDIVTWLSRNENHQLDNDGSQLGHFLETEKYGNWHTYCKMMSKDCVWGDQMTLLAASELYNTKIHILSNVKTPENSTPITIIEPRSHSKSTKTIYLSHWHEKHYNSMYKKSDVAGN